MEIINNAGIEEDELKLLVQEEVEHYSGFAKYKKGIQAIEFNVKDGEVWSTVTPVPAEIVRVRRITGYLSKEQNFNDAKLAELKDRVSHEF